MRPVRWSILRGKDEAAVQKKEGRWQLKLTGEQAVPAAKVEALFEEIANTYEMLLGLKSDFIQWRFEQKEAAIKGNLFRDLYEKADRIPLSKLASGKPIKDAK